MHLMYVDESGDPGFGVGSSARYVRGGVVVHGWKWREVDERIRSFKLTRGLNWDAEIRANDIRRGHNAFAEMPAAERQTLLEDLLETLAREMPDVSLIGICIHKHNVDTTRRERFSNPAVRSIELLLENYNSFLASQRDRCGIVVLDELEAKHDASIRYFQNYLCRFSDHVDGRRIVEGTFFLPSRSSNPLRLPDVCANVLLRRYRWDQQSVREWAIVEDKFTIREWPHQQKERPRGT